MEYDNITSDEGEEDHGAKNDIKNQPWLKKSEPVNKPIKISVIKKTISLPSQELNRNQNRLSPRTKKSRSAASDSRTEFLQKSILSIVKPAKNGPWGRFYYYENETKISSQFKAVHENIHITGYDEENADAVWKFGGPHWNIGSFQNMKRTDAARKIRRNLGNGIHLKWSKVRDILI